VRYTESVRNASTADVHSEFQGGGIVFDSIEEDEYVETINKLGANVRCIDAAEGEILMMIVTRGVIAC
jgi:anthranilate/para-aminobenzoate synthase component I